MNSKSIPPSAAEIAAVLTACASTVTSLASAAMHLASPVDATVGSDVWRDKGFWNFRGELAPINEDSIFEAAEAAADLALRTNRPGDTYLSLTDDPRSWIKVIVSGATKIPFGLSLLCGRTFTTLKNEDEKDILDASAAMLAGRPIPRHYKSYETLLQYTQRMKAASASSKE